MTTRLLTALAFLAAAGSFATLATADHCQTGLAMYGRSVFTPLPAPHVSNAPGACIDDVGPVDVHSLPATSDQIFVRVNAALSASWPSVVIELDGLGFENALFNAVRTTHDLTGTSYDMTQWVSIPGGSSASGDITATLHHPGRFTLSITYHKDAMPQAPTITPPAVQPPAVPTLPDEIPAAGAPDAGL